MPIDKKPCPPKARACANGQALPDECHTEHLKPLEAPKSANPKGSRERLGSLVINHFVNPDGTHHFEMGNGLDNDESESTATVLVHDLTSTTSETNGADEAELASGIEAVEQTEAESEKLREEIRTLQAEASKKFQTKLNEELKHFLPAHILEKDLRVKKEHQNENTPTLFDLEVARAKASAELGVCLSYCSSTEKKIRLLTVYKELEQTILKSDALQTKMKKLAEMHPLTDENGDVVCYTPAETEKKHKTGPKSAVHQLPPMLPRKRVPTSADSNSVRGWPTKA